MAKDTTTPKATDPLTPSLAPLFAMNREALAELDRQAERWLDYGAAQANEAVKASRAMMAQSMAATRALFDAAEDVAQRSLESVAPMMKPFGGAKA